jgi:DNA-binding NarL/FixJ family response regulator
LGRTPEAIALVEEEVELLRTWGAPTFLGAGLRLLGELRGPGSADGVDALREAVAVLEPSQAAVELARARCALGSSSRIGDEEAVPLLVAAYESANARGALALRDRARDALEGRGNPVEAGCDEVRSLTATERTILDLTAAGVDVREVAQRLFVTPGTVRAALDAADAQDGKPPPQVVLK